MSGTLPVPNFAPDVDHNPFALSDIRVLLPTRRAARAFKVALSDATDGAPILLPKIAVLGDADEAEELMLSGLEDRASAPLNDRLLTEVERHLCLSRLVGAWAGRRNRSKGAPAPGLFEVLHLTSELLSLMDQVTLEGATWRDIQKLAIEDVAGHWQEIIAFLEIAQTAWPHMLAEYKLVDPVVQRERHLTQLAEGLSDAGSDDVIIAAGLPGSSLASLDFVSVIAQRPRGLLVLPGVDLQATDEEWAAVGACDGSDPAHFQVHPQYPIKRILTHILGLNHPDLRKDIVALGEVKPSMLARDRLVSTALCSASGTATWHQTTSAAASWNIDAATPDLTLLEATNAREEATAVSLIVREALEDPQRRVAVITPDRELARRIAVDLKRWGIEADDSAGVPLSRTPAGIVTQLALEAATQAFDPVGLLALLKHPYVTLHRPRVEVLRLTRVIERYALRLPALKAAALSPKGHLSNALAELPAESDLSETLRSALCLLEEIDDLLAPLRAVCGQQLYTAPEAAAALTSVMETLLLPSETDVSPQDRPDIQALNRLLDDLATLVHGQDLSSVEAFSDIFAYFSAQRSVTRPLTSSHKISIWGSLEARLQSIDLAILAGLNEGTWPRAVQANPFLSRTMGLELGLSAPERAIGLAANDFQFLMGTPSVVLTRSLKEGGSPAVASRFLQRLTTVLGEERTATLRKKGQRYLALSRRLNQHDGPLSKVERPAPRPPVDLRPAKLSVTEIETLVRDPYAIYARHVLKLRPLEALFTRFGPAERGSLYHNALEAVFRAFPDGDLSQRHRETVEHLVAEVFDQAGLSPDLDSLWRVRFQRIVHALLEDGFGLKDIGTGTGIGTGAGQVRVELTGYLDFQVGNRSFTLTARADRIDQLAGGGLRIVDYKTGEPPSAKQVHSFFSPQLPLEAWMIAEGAFNDVSRSDREIKSLSYIRLSGGTPPVRVTEVGGETETEIKSLAEATAEQLKALLAKYTFQATGYLSRARPFQIKYPSDYDHLARVDEWQLDAGSDGSGDGEGGSP